MAENKKVYMILTNGFDPDVRVYKEAKYISSRGYDVEILCWDRKCNYLKNQNEKFGNIVIKRFSFSAVPGTGIKQIKSYYKFLINVKRYLKTKEYAFLHCHDFDGALIGFICNIGRKKDNMIFDMHEIYDNYKFAKIKMIFNFMYSKLLKFSKFIIYVNDEQIKGFEKYKGKLIYLPNFPSLETYMPIKKNNSDKLCINYIGAVRDYQSLKTLCDINNYSIGIYGTGAEYESLKRDMKNNSNVILYGKFNGIKESGEIYRKTDILYCVYNPSVLNWRVAYPVKLSEAIVTETPIIVSKDTEVGKFVEQNSIGMEVKYANRDELQMAIKMIKKNYSSYVNNIKKIKENYVWEDVAKNLDYIYCI